MIGIYIQSELYFSWYISRETEPGQIGSSEITEMRSETWAYLIYHETKEPDPKKHFSIQSIAEKFPKFSKQFY